MPIAGRHRRR